MNPMGRAGEVGMRRGALSTRVTGSVAGHDERRLWEYQDWDAEGSVIPPC